MRTECRCGHLNLTLDSFYAAGTRTLGLYQSWCKIPFQNVYPRALPSTTYRHSPCIQFFYQINWNSIRCVFNDFLRHMHYRVWVSFINGAQNSINFKSISILSVSKQCSNNSRGRLSPSHIQYGILFGLLTIQYLSGLRESSGLI
jgi:hypothetical protein